MRTEERVYNGKKMAAYLNKEAGLGLLGHDDFCIYEKDH